MNEQEELDDFLNYKEGDVLVINLKHKTTLAITKIGAFKRIRTMRLLDENITAIVISSGVTTTTIDLKQIEIDGIRRAIESESIMWNLANEENDDMSTNYDKLFND
jgi:hypothetical protein